MRERRKFPRVQEICDVAYRVLGDLGASWHEVSTVNLSASGLRVRSAEPLEPNTVLELKIQLAGFKEELVLHASVVWSRMHSPGVVEHGMQFTDIAMVQQAQLDRLVQFLQQRV